MFLKNDNSMDDEEEPISGGYNEVYEFFTKYVRRIHPDTYWKKSMNLSPNVFWFQLVTPSDIVFARCLKMDCQCGTRRRFYSKLRIVRDTNQDLYSPHEKERKGVLGEQHGVRRV